MQYIFTHICALAINGACKRVYADMSNEYLCLQYEQLPLHVVANEDVEYKRVPDILHVISSTKSPPYIVNSTSRANPSYSLNYHNDDSAREYIHRHCGREVQQAFVCLEAPAYRADLFRFCALYAQGGVYLDADLIPAVPLREIYLADMNATFGHDWPQDGVNAGVQMKIVAGVPKNEIFKCMMDRIVQHVKWRYIPESALYVSGPSLLRECVYNYSLLHGPRKAPKLAPGGALSFIYNANIAYTYLDTRNAIWPFTGMRTRQKLLTYEKPNEERHWRKADRADYGALHASKHIYSATCELTFQTGAPKIKQLSIGARMTRAQKMGGLTVDLSVTAPMRFHANRIVAPKAWARSSLVHKAAIWHADTGSFNPRVHANRVAGPKTWARSFPVHKAATRHADAGGLKVRSRASSDAAAQRAKMTSGLTVDLSPPR